MREILLRACLLLFSVWRYIIIIALNISALNIFKIKNVGWTIGVLLALNRIQ